MKSHAVSVPEVSNGTIAPQDDMAKEITQGAPLVRHLEVDPSLAVRWLNHCVYDRQRPVRATHVGVLADAMAAGTFKSGTIEFVRHAGRRYLTDGQHRLNAIVQSGVTVPMLIVEHAVDSEDELHRTYARTDRGMGRSVPDVMKALGIFQESTLSRSMVQRAATACGMLITGFEPQTRTNTAAKSAEIRASVLHEWLSAAESWVSFIAGAHEHLAKRLVSAPCMAVGMVTARYQEARAEQFWGRLASDDGLSVGEPEHTLSRYLVGHPVTARGAGLYARTVASAWNAAYRGDNFSRPSTREESLNRPILIAGTPYDGKTIRVWNGSEVA